MKGPASPFNDPVCKHLKVIPSHVLTTRKNSVIDDAEASAASTENYRSLFGEMNKLDNHGSKRKVIYTNFGFVEKTLDKHIEDFADSGIIIMDKAHLI